MSIAFYLFFTYSDEFLYILVFAAQCLGVIKHLFNNKVGRVKALRPVPSILLIHHPTRAAGGHQNPALHVPELWGKLPQDHNHEFSRSSRHNSNPWIYTYYLCWKPCTTKRKRDDKNGLRMNNRAIQKRKDGAANHINRLAT